MARLMDNKKTVEIRMYGANGAEWSDDFFEVGNLEYDEGKDAHVVSDVAYCIEQAYDWKNGVGDFYNPDAPDAEVDREVYVD